MRCDDTHRCSYITAFSIGLRRFDVSMPSLLCMATYAIGIFFYLQPTLPSELFAPVFVYAAVIATMATLALSRPLPDPPTSFNLRFSKLSGVVGALVFIVSVRGSTWSCIALPWPLAQVAPALSLRRSGL